MTTLVAAVFGLSGAATVPQIGATFDEIPLAVFVVMGVMILLSALRRAKQQLDQRPILVAGGLFGLVAGLKLTAAIYAPAAILAVIAALRNTWIRPAVFFSIAWGVRFVFPTAGGPYI